MRREKDMTEERRDLADTQRVTWDELERLRQNWEELASRVAEIEEAARENRSDPPALDFDEDKLADIAASIYASRKRRVELFSPSLFGEPAWDMLLILFIRRARGEQVSVTKLCACSGTPHSTGLRWIERLQSQGLVKRTRAKADTRIVWVEISDTGYNLMRRYVVDGIARFQMPLPD